jgi:Tol biopolymer transport system component
VKDGEIYIGVVPVTGEKRAVQIVARGNVGWRPGWSADGTRVGFWIMNGKQVLYSTEVDNPGDPLTLPHQAEGQYNSDPAWSPDGTRIAFASDR